VSIVLVHYIFGLHILCILSLVPGNLLDKSYTQHCNIHSLGHICHILFPKINLLKYLINSTVEAQLWQAAIVLHFCCFSMQSVQVCVLQGCPPVVVFVFVFLVVPTFLSMAVFSVSEINSDILILFQVYFNSDFVYSKF